jgi:hypothetical protein
LFDSDDSGLVDISYVSKAVNELLFDGMKWKRGDQMTNHIFVAEVLELGARGVPSCVAFHFQKPIESADMVWIYFDWPHGRHAIFTVPQIGDTVRIAGAGHRR